VSTFHYDWSGSPRLDALLHELGASLRRDFEHRELSVTAALPFILSTRPTWA
jgi:hypothetical protein